MKRQERRYGVMANIIVLGVQYILTVTTVLSIAIDAAYIGCYKEVNKPLFNINPGAIVKGSLTPDICYTLCGKLGHPYAGVTKGLFCLCSNKSPDGSLSKESDDAKCNRPCVGDTSQLCGSLTHIRIYSTPAAVTVSINAAPKIVGTGDAVTLIPSIEPDGIGFGLRMNYDDNAGMTEYSQNGTGLLSHSFYQAGEYEIRSYATDVDNMLADVTSATSVVVHTGASGVIVTCADTMATYELYTCTVEVLRGTDMQLTLDYTNGNMVPPEPFSITDATEFSIGNYVQEHLDHGLYESVTSTAGLIVQHGNQAEYTGAIVGFEYHAVNTGTVTVYVYRPDCAGSMYCYLTNTCDPSNTCTRSCSVNGYCSDIDDCCGSPTARNDNLLDTYNQVHAISLVISSVGYGYAEATALDIQPGDVLVHDGIDPPLIANGSSNQAANALSDYYCTGLVGPASFTASPCALTTEFHQLKAIYAMKSESMFELEFEEQGAVLLTVTASNHDTSNIGGSESVSTSITVVDGVDAAIFEVPECVETDVTTTFKVKQYTGSPASVEWNFDPVIQTEDDTVSTDYTYTSHGIYNLTVNITNGVSYKFNHTILCVEERITGLTLNTPVSVVEVSTDTYIDVSMTSGTDYTCIFQLTTVAGTTSVSKTDTDGLQFNHIFEEAGDITISISCSNSISTVSINSDGRAVERLTNVALTPPGAVAKQDFQLLLAWDTGTDVTLSSFTYDSSNVAMTVSETLREARSNDIMSEDITGLHTITYTISNAINSISVTDASFAIEIEITNHVIICTFLNPSSATTDSADSVISVNTGVECTVDMDAGTSVVITVDFDDGTPNNVQTAASSETWELAKDGFTFPITHIFSTSGYFKMSLMVSNGFNSVVENYPVWVMIGVEDVTMVCPTPTVRFDPPATLNFNFDYTDVPNAVKCYFDWGDDTYDEYDPCDITTTYKHIYRDQDGDLTVSYALSNLVSSKSGSLMVYIVSPIVQMECYTSRLAAITGEPIDLVFKAGLGPPAGVLNLTFDCDMSVAGDLGTRKRTGDSPDGVDTEECTYTVPGTYTMSIRAESWLEDKPCTHTFKVLNPVTEDFVVLTTGPPVDYEMHQTCIIVYSIQYTGSPFPDEAFVELDYGDGTPIDGPINLALIISKTYEYATHGHYATSIRIYNDASEVFRIVQTGCYAMFLDMTIDVLREPRLPLNSPDQPGYGSTQNMYRTDEAIIIHTTLQTGTFVWWDVSAVSATDIYTCNSTEKDIITFFIDKYGTYTIKVTARNPLHEGPTQTYTAEVMKPVDELEISEFKQTSAYEDKDFNVTMVSYGTAMCVAVNYGDDDLSVETYGDSVTCSDTSFLEFEAFFSGATVQNGIVVDVSQVFTLTHQYLSEGTFNIKIYAWNVFSSATAEFQFAVSGIDCGAPNINIKQRARDFRSPNVFLRSKRIKITGITNIECPNTLHNKKKWTAFLWYQTTNTLIRELDINNVLSSVNSELAFPPHYFPYGVYLLRYKVTMLTDGSSGEEFSSEAETFIEVQPTEIVVQLFADSMSMISVGPNALLIVSPKTYSYDPDIEAGAVDNFDLFRMACRDVTLNETFPNTSEEVTALNITDLPTDHVDTGGCFQQGAGWIKDFSGTVTFWTTILKQGHTYEFKVIGEKDTRSSYFLGKVIVKSANPPSFKMETKIPGIFAPNSGGKRFNPNAQLGLMAKLLTACPACTFKWEMFAYDYRFCGPIYECLRKLAYLMRYIEGTESDELTIHVPVFDHYATVDNFYVRLAVTDGDTGVDGIMQLHLTRNHPPAGGICTISPNFGLAFETNFTIGCSGFTDVDGDNIADYIISCKNTKGEWIDIANSDSPSWEIYLPSGDPNNDDNLTCTVTVKDELGAAGTYPIPGAQVKPVPMDNFRELLKDMASSDTDMSDIIVAGANLGTVASFVTSLASALHDMSEEDEFSAYAGLGTVTSYTSTGLDSTGNRTSAFTQSKIDPEELKKYEETRSAAAKSVEMLVDTFEKCTADSPGEITTLVNALALVSESKAHLTRKTQLTLTSLLSLSVKNIVNNIHLMSVEQVESIGESILASCSNTGEVAVITAENPVSSDLETQNENVKTFSTNMDSDLKDVGTFDNDADVLNDGKHILNAVEQNTFASSNLHTCAVIQKDVVAILATKIPKSPDPRVLKSSSFEAKIFKNDAKALVNKTVTTGGCNVVLPPDMLSGDDQDEAFILAVVTTAASGAPIEESSAGDVYSRTVSITLTHTDGTPKSVNNLETPVELLISRDPNAPRVDFSALPYAEPVIVEGQEDTYLFYHEVQVVGEMSALILKFRPTNISEDNQLLVLVNYDEYPDLDWDRTKVKKACSIPSKTKHTGFFGSDEEEDPYSCFIDPDIISNNTGSWRIGVLQLLPTELDRYEETSDLPRAVPAEWKENKRFNQDYQFSAAEISCSYMTDGSSVRRTDGVKPSRWSTEEAVLCSTTHLTTFAGGWVVAPNTIDWNFVFSNADFFKNPTLYITEIVIAVAYVIAMVWARRKDKHDVEKLGLAPLLDNDSRDKYYYEIMVSTGMRRGAGTESKVHFILSGDDEETEVRTFEDKKRSIFTRGSNDGFLMSVPESIGALMYLRIWHDNSGKGRVASWYLNHVVVRDVQTDKKYYFIANRWFAVEEDDGQVDRVLPVAGKEQMTEFSHLFAERATKNLSDGHLWFSVVARPPQSRFTRCQRVSCCLCLLYTSMLANAMFYGTETSDGNAYQFGPFALTSEQIFIGVMANIIIFPVNFLLITIFRKSRPRKLRPSRVEEALKSVPERTTSMADVNPRMKSSLDFDRPGSSFLMDGKRAGSSMSHPGSSISDAKPNIPVPKKKKKCELPWWFTIVAWILLWMAILVSAAFVTFYGIMFQDIKCKKWITSMLISFFMSVFFTQPIKVFLFAIIFSVIIKKPGADEDDDDEEEAPKKLESDEEYLHEDEDEFGFITPRKPMYKPKPPNTKALETARKQRLKEIQMWSVIREIVFYAFFLWILLVVSYRNVSVDSYNYKYNMQKVFILTNDTNKAFSKVKNTNDFWIWAKSGMLRGLRAGPYYNDFPPFYMRGYINDKQSRLMGYAVLRQARTRPNTCKIPWHMESIIYECNAAYDIADEEDRDFGAGWATIGVNNSREEYKFRTASSLDGYPYWGEMALYGGGGYLLKLNKDYSDMIADLVRLENEGWIDKYTRAIFLEFTVYNPSINLFSVSTLLAEFRPSGGVFSSFRFEPCNLLPYMNSALLFQVICEITYFAFTVFFVIKEITYIIKQKKQYFFQFWNLVDLGICAMSVTAIVIYFYRLFSINRLTEYFKETHGNEYMKFQYIGYWSEISNYIMGFLVFFATLKFMKLLRFNRKISLLSDTLKNSSKDLIHFSIILNVVFLAFIQVFYLVYMSHLDIFKSFVSSCEAGIVMMMGKFDIYNMLEVNQWLTQVFLFLFVVAVTFIVVNMLLSILNDTFSAVRKDRNKQQNDYEIVDFMLGRFKTWTGIGRDSTTISPTDKEERNKNYRTLEGQIDYFPDQIDRFLASISHMYMGDAKFDDFLHKGMAKKMAMKAQTQQSESHPPPRLPGALRISNGARGMTDVQTD